MKALITITIICMYLMSFAICTTLIMPHLPRSQSSSNNRVDYLEAALRPLPMLLGVENQPTN